jgi:asparagine synthase (glutamine-hydrolysing)
MRPLLPDSLYRRQKFAFMAPPSHTDAGKQAAAGRLVDRYLGAERVRAVGLFDPGRVASFVARSRTESASVRQVRNDAILNQLLGIHILHDELC